MKKYVYFLSLFFSLTTIVKLARADDVNAQANNPLANMTSVSFQNYYYPNISGFETTGDMFWLRYAKPIAGKFILRASMPFANLPVSPSSKESGSSDFNVFAAYLFDTGNRAINAGIGPLLVAPTASPSLLGAGKWQGGLAAVFFNATSAKIQYGSLVTYQADFAGNKNREHTSLMEIQPFVFMQLKKGAYLRTAPIWSFDFENNYHVIPLSLGIGKVIQSGNIVFNLFIEPQYSVSTKGIDQPTSQIFSGLNMQFKSK